MRFSAACYFCRYFSPRRLIVDAALGSDDQIGFAERSIDLYILHDDFVAWVKPSVQKYLESCTETSRCSTSRLSADINIQFSLDYVGIVIERCLQGRYGLWSSPFLGTK